MRKAIAALTLVIATGVNAFWGKAEPLFKDSPDIQHFTKETLTDVVLASESMWVIDFYAPWCPHCQHFAPHYEAIADYYAESQLIKWGAIDCSVEDALCSEYSIYGYPTLKLFNVEEKPINMPPHGMAKSFRSVVEWVENTITSHNKTTGIELPDFELYKDIGYGGTIPPRSTSVKRTSPNLRGKEDAARLAADARVARLRDAGHALMISLETGMFLGTSVLESHRYTTAELWLKLLAGQFPLKENQEQLGTLLYRFQSQSKWTQGEWKLLIATWKEDVYGQTYPSDLFSHKKLEFCTTYTCGIWQLFHSLTETSTKENAVDVAWRIRDFVQNFFGCETCVTHFSHANPDSTLNAIGKAYDPSAALVLWLYHMHNSVNARTKHDNFPLKQDCPKCYATDDSVYEPEVLKYMKTIYSFPDSDALIQRDIESNVAAFDPEGAVSFAGWDPSSPFTVQIGSIAFVVVFLAAVYRRYGRGRSTASILEGNSVEKQL